MRPIPALQLKQSRNGVKKHQELSQAGFFKNVILIPSYVVGLSDAFEKVVEKFRFYNQFKENFLLVI